MIKNLFFIFFVFISLTGFSIDIDTITNKIIVLNDGYDRVSAVKTSKGIVIIDTHKSTKDMSKMRSHIIDYFNDSNFVYIINTHPCLEHINGNLVFPRAQKIAHANFATKTYPDSSDGRIAFLTKKRIPALKTKIAQTTDSTELKDLTKQLEYFMAMRNDFFKSAVPPDMTFTDKMTLRVGDLTFEMVYMGDGAHGNSSILIYIPEEKTLFTGSALAMPPIVYKTGGWIQKQEVERWIFVLDHFIAKPDFEHIVPSHILYYSKQDLKEMRDYYFLISITIKKQLSNKSAKDETFQLLHYDLINKQFNIFTSDTQAEDRHKNNIEILWNYFKNQTVRPVD